MGARRHAKIPGTSRQIELELQREQSLTSERIGKWKRWSKRQRVSTRSMICSTTWSTRIGSRNGRIRRRRRFHKPNPAGSGSLRRDGIRGPAACPGLPSRIYRRPAGRSARLATRSTNQRNRLVLRDPRQLNSRRCRRPTPRQSRVQIRRRPIGGPANPVPRDCRCAKEADDADGSGGRESWRQIGFDHRLGRRVRSEAAGYRHPGGRRARLAGMRC